MPQNYGLGRGLSSLIPQKKRASSNDEGKTIAEPQKDFNYFGASNVPSSVQYARPSAAKIEEKSAESKEMARAPISNSNVVKEVEINRIVPNPHQPRIKFDETKLQELSDSIKIHGILQPLIVSQSGAQYEIIAGERRYQAAKLAGLTTVPVIVRDVNEQQKLELAIIENIQRHDLNPIEEAKSYQKLMDEFDLTQEEVGVKLGKSRPGVANKLRLLNLPVEIQKGIMEGKISEGHAKAILAIENPEKQRALYELILKSSLTVRQTEDKTKEISVKPHTRKTVIDPQSKQIEDSLSQSLNTKVKLSKSGQGGKITIEYYSSEELNNIINKITK